LFKFVRGVRRPSAFWSAASIAALAFFLVGTKKETKAAMLAALQN
jgi:hypothetical protein